MAISRTLEFLPEFLKTTANKKFLAATLDQLIAEPSVKKFNGYIGRQFFVGYQNEDRYITEPTTGRQNYQLEPSVVVADQNNKVEFYSSYPDLIQQIGFYGGITTKHSRLFENQSYTYDPHISFDKLSNFGNYYWLPQGPENVNVGIKYISGNKDFEFIPNLNRKVYTVKFQDGLNPDIVLRRGGTYKFIVNQANNPFYIQSEPGISGTRASNPKISSRNIFGVTNNGDDVGTITFVVPSKNAQNNLAAMPVSYEADLATNKQFRQIDNKLLSEVQKIDGFGGDINNKTLVFVDQSTSPLFWTSLPAIDGNGDSVSGYPVRTIVTTSRANAFQIKLVPVPNGTLVTLVDIYNTPVDTRIFVKYGDSYGGVEFYRPNGQNYLQSFPQITADLDFLYYQNSKDSAFFGKIKIVDDASSINVDEEIVGKKNYISPNGVVFTNGLKITFDNQVTPAKYQNSTYIIEGVGKSIELVPFNAASITDIDYITIARNSADRNDWSYTNRWTHESVIKAASIYNKTTPIYNQDHRARRPIIEFEPDLQLYNFGREYIATVDFLDNTETDAFGTEPLTKFAGLDNRTYSDGFFTVGRYYQITNLGTTTNSEWNTIAGTTGVTYTVGSQFRAVTQGTGSHNGTAQQLLKSNTGVSLSTGQKIIFSNDTNLSVRKTIYKINIVVLDGNVSTVILTPETSALDYQNVYVTGDVILSSTQTVSNKHFYLEGNTWKLSQTKTIVNQLPLFDIVDNNFSSLSLLPLSSFSGSKIFGYRIGNGNDDVVLGFPLSYKSINNIGDIEFVNHYELESFQTLVGQKFVTRQSSSGFVVKNLSRTQRQKLNVWSVVNELTKQYQHYTVLADGTKSSYNFSLTPVDQSRLETNLKVYLDGVLQNSDQYSLSVGTSTTITFPTKLSADVKLDVLINSTNFDTDAYYQIPDNLEINPLNKDFEYLTLGQIRNHTKEIFSRLNDLEGLELGGNNSKDLDYTNIAGKILQHGSPIIYANLFLTHDRANFIDSIQYAQREYSKFKNRFLEQATKLNITHSNEIVNAVDQIISTINFSKSTDSPWYYSDMVPHGTNYQKFVYQVLDVDIRNYFIETIFKDNENSNRAVLVYYNGKQLLKGRDYSFSTTVPAIVLADNFTVELSDEIKIIDYADTDGNFIPETPSKLGLYPRFEPKIYLDDRYSNPTLVIQGHDGSITPCFGDFRDQLLLELELRIYNNIKTEFDEGIRSVLYNVKPGKFKTNLYTLDEYNLVLSKSFLKWLGSNQVDYVNNLTYQNGNSRTWNYKRSASIFNNELLPGHWRAIFNYLFDTDRPNTHPWEMLGFSIEPLWWQTTYGPGPYTGGNISLWKDLEQGIIRSGDRAGIDKRFARPGLSTFIPVDEFGNIKTPDQFLISNLSSNTTAAAWAVGDQGPVETAWKLSSDFPFAVQQALALTRPAEYFGLLIDNRRYEYDSSLGQLLFTKTKDRLRPEQILINGIDSTGVVNRISGYTNFIADYLTGQGLQGSVYVKNLIDNLDVRLAYRLSGFTDKKNLSAYVEQSSPGSKNDSILIPQENYQLYLHKSAPNRKATYSAVVVKKTRTGFTVEGYDYNSPYFTIVPSRVSNDFITIAGIETTAKVYKDYQLVYLTIPYGFEFTSRQQVVDFLVSYQRYLVGQGFLFNEFDQDLKRARDWILSATEFLSWSEQGWGDNSIIVLSPCVGNLTLIDYTATVDEINGKWTGSRLLDQNFTGIDNINFDVIRDSDSFQLTTLNDRIIGLADLALVQYEHVLILDNETVFNDVIYNSEIGNRQYRIKINGVKSGNWTGRLNAPGFIFNNGEIADWVIGKDYAKGDLVKYKNQIYTALEFVEATDKFEFENWALKTGISQSPEILINFAGNAKKFLNIYDVDADYFDIDLEQYSNNLIGFKNRSYLDDFTLDTKTQIKFYQGFIKEKGTANAVNALTRAKFNKITGDINFAEEWAIRVGTYGAVDNEKVVEIVIGEQLNTSDPFGVEILQNSTETGTNKFRSYRYNELYDAPVNFDLKLFNYRNSQTGTFDQDLTTAGFVKENEADFIVFDLADSTEQLTALVQNIGIDYVVWTAKDFTGQWNVYKTVGTDHQVQYFSFGLDKTCQITTFDNNNLVQGDIFIVKDFDPILDGVYSVVSKDSPNTVTVKVSDLKSQYLAESGTLESIGVVYRLISIKFNKLTDILTKKWDKGSKVYIEESNSWKVYEKTDPFDWKTTFAGKTTNESWGISTAISGDETIVSIGVPSTSNSYIEYYNISTPSTPYYKSLAAPVASSANFGYALTQAEGRLIASSKSSSRNYVAVFDYANNKYNCTQIITGPDSQTEFGYSLSISQDKKWLAVGSPNSSVQNVYVYKLVDIEPHAQQIQIIEVGGNAQTNYTLTWTPVDINSLRVYHTNSDTFLLPGVHFTLAGTTLTFTSTPTVGNFYVVRDSSFYKLAKEINPFGLSANDRFADQIKLTNNGQKLFVTSPDFVSGSKNGALYTFDRTIEAFIATAGQTVFTTKRVLNDLLYDVRVDGQLKILNVDYTKTSSNTITFNTPLTTTSRIEIDTNDWLQELYITSPISQAGSRFGASLDVCQQGCNLYVGQPDYYTSEYQRGAVLRYVNIPYVNNSITGTVIATPNSVVSVNDSIRINDQEITFTAGSLTHVVSAINAKQILGITAEIVGGNKLKISIDRTLSPNSLKISTGDTQSNVPTIVKLGLNIFQHQQTLLKPDLYDNESYGTKLRTNITGDILLVSGQGGYNDRYSVFDADTEVTTFDVDSTSFYDRSFNTGNVYEYELLTNSDSTSGLEFVQKLLPGSILSNSNFGINTILTDKTIIALSKVSASLGKIHLFQNPAGTKGWNLLRTNENTVDLDSIGTLYLYDKRKNSIVTYLDNIDPLRGKILGAADQEIDYKATFDPAVYNVVDGIDVSSTQQYFWSQRNVGRVWWNLDTVRCIEYQQDTLDFKFNNWGRLFPGSSIDIYEWVESSVLPSRYVENGGSGVPKNPDDSLYSVIRAVDPDTGLIKVQYYFWVYNKITEIPGRNISVAGIKTMIEQPMQQGIPYVAVLDDHSLALYNCRQFLTGNDIVLKIIGNKFNKELPIHNEWQILKENDTETIPEFLVEKMFDSIIGQIETTTSAGTIVKLVPDIKLPPNKRYGISVRPRQSMFVNRLTAAKVYVEFLNKELSKNIIVGRRNLSRLTVSDPIPASSQYDFEFDTYDELAAIDLAYVVDQKKFLVRSDRNRNGNWSIYKNNNKVLTIVSTQQYNVSNFWSYINWYEEGFDSRTVPDYTVNDFSLAPATGILTGEYIKINNTGAGTWGIFRKTDSGYDPVALQNGTIEIDSVIFDPDIGGIGYESTHYDDGYYDYNPATDLKILLNVIKDDILIEDLKYIFNRSIFTMFEYVLFEQRQPDWLFKTSFISVIHKLRQLINYPNYVLDNQDYYKSYIEEVKPYKTKIREYLLSYDGIDNTAMDVTDFDYPVFFDKSKNSYVYPVAGIDNDIINSPPWLYWKNNSTYKIDYVSVINSGDNYQVPPTLVVTGGDGSARLTAVVSAGKLIGVTVDNPGNGFLSSPTITVYALPNNDGSTGNGAVLKARIINDRVRTFDTTIKFDRTEYSGEIANYATGTVSTPKNYRAGDFFVYLNKLYLVLNDFSQTGQAFNTFTISSTLSSQVTTIREYSAFQPISIANSSNFPTSGHIKIDNEYFYYSSISGNNLLGIERAKFETEIANHNTGATVTLVDYKLALVSDLSSAMKRSYYYYNPLPGMTANDVKALFAGVEYPGVKIQGGVFFDTTVNANLTLTNSGTITIAIGSGQPAEPTQAIKIIWNSDNYMQGVIQTYNPNTGLMTVKINSSKGGGTYNGVWTLEKDEITEYDILQEGEVTPELKNLDVWYKSSFLDTSLGVNPEDINVAAGKFVDSANSHAPEELIPGRIYDTLEIRVFNKFTNNNIVAWRQFHSMNSNIEDANRNPSGIVQIIEAIDSAATQFTVKLFDQTPLQIPVQQTITVTSASNNRFTCNNTGILRINKEIVFSGTVFGGVTIGTTYYVKEIVDANKFTISETITNGLAGGIKTLTSGSGSMTGTPDFYLPEIMINGELMDYSSYNPTTGVVSGIRRGRNGPAKSHAANSFVTVLNNLQGTRYYYRISNTHTTTLAQNLNATDTQIKLTDASKMAQPSVVDNKPGVIYIDGERIHYWTINYETRVLGQIIRGVYGTGIAATHAAGVKVTSASEDQLLDTGDYRVWPQFAQFNATIAGTTMTVTGNVNGVIALQQTLYGPGIVAGTKITGYGTGIGGAGTYYLSVGHSIALATTMKSGASFQATLQPDAVASAEVGFIAQYLSYAP